MKKALKIFGWIVFSFLFLTIGFGIYMYNTNPFIKAAVNKDESKLFYFPTKTVSDLSAFDYEEIALKVEDTVTVYNYFFKAQTDSVKGTVFFIHGSGGNASKAAPFMRPFLENGYQVYAVDWRGYGKSNGRPLHINVLEDTKKAFRDMLTRKEVKSKKVVVLGLSLGGQVAVALTKTFQEDVDALVLDGSAVSFSTLAADNTPYEFLKAQAAQTAEPYRALDDIKEVSNTPKLIIQSKDDQWVGLSRGKALFANAQEPKEFWQTEGKHTHTLINQPDEVIRKVESLLQ
jgi:uncharacterized protein